MKKGDTWDQLVALDRPLVLDTRTPEKFSSSVLVVGFSDRSAWTLSALGVKKIPLMQLASDWTGSYRYLWQAPPEWTGSIGIGDSGPAVEAVAEFFAELDGQGVAITTDTFTPLLETRVKLFQRSLGLVEDGLVTRQVLIILENKVKPDLPLSQRLARAKIIVAAP